MTGNERQIPFCRPGLERVQDTLGARETRRLAQLPRNQIMSELRVRHRWTLQAIGDLFELSRERVRQLTPPIEGAGISPFGEEESAATSAAAKTSLPEVLRLAARTPEAWSQTSGRLLKAWVVEQLGCDPTSDDVDFQRLSKMAVLVRYGLGLETKDEMGGWANEMRHGRAMSYDEIARWLSRECVPVDTMTVYRFLKRLGGANDDD